MQGLWNSLPRSQFNIILPIKTPCAAVEGGGGSPAKAVAVAVGGRLSALFSVF